MVVQGVTSRQRQSRTLLDAAALLEERGIAVDVNALPQTDFPTSMTLERDSAWEQQQFSGLLGEVTAAQRGLVSYYESPLGRAEVLEDGSFSISFAPGAFPLDGRDMADHSLSILSRMGFDARASVLDDGAVEAVQLLDGTPVLSCAVTLRYEDGALAELSGVRLAGPPAADFTQAAPLSVATLLLRFRSGIIDSGDACSVIRSATQGYVLSPGSGGKSGLTPVLRLETDTGFYHLDALTGAFSRE